METSKEIKKLWRNLRMLVEIYVEQSRNLKMLEGVVEYLGRESVRGGGRLYRIVLKHLKSGTPSVINELLLQTLENVILTLFPIELQSPVEKVSIGEWAEGNAVTAAEVIASGAHIPKGKVLEPDGILGRVLAG